MRFFVTDAVLRVDIQFCAHWSDPDTHGSCAAHYAVTAQQAGVLAEMARGTAQAQARSKAGSRASNPSPSPNGKVGTGRGGGSPVDSLVPPHPFNARDPQGMTPLHWVVIAHKPSPAVLTELLRGGADCSLPSADGHNVLHLAVLQEDVAVLDTLLAYLGDVASKELARTPDRAGNLPVHAAIVRGNNHMPHLKQLAKLADAAVAYGPVPAGSATEPLVFLCIAQGMAQAFRALLDQFPEALNSGANTRGSCVLHEVCKVHAPQMCMELLVACTTANEPAWRAVDWLRHYSTAYLLEPMLHPTERIL
jgi:hypothetical protein